MSSSRRSARSEGSARHPGGARGEQQGRGRGPRRRAARGHEHRNGSRRSASRRACAGTSSRLFFFTTKLPHRATAGDHRPLRDHRASVGVQPRLHTPTARSPASNALSSSTCSVTPPANASPLSARAGPPTSTSSRRPKAVPRLFPLLPRGARGRSADASRGTCPSPSSSKGREGFLKQTGPVTPADLIALDAEIRSVFFGPDPARDPRLRARGWARWWRRRRRSTVSPDLESAILDVGLAEARRHAQGSKVHVANEHDDYVNGDPTPRGWVRVPPSAPGAPGRRCSSRSTDPAGREPRSRSSSSSPTGAWCARVADFPVDTAFVRRRHRGSPMRSQVVRTGPGHYLTPTDYSCAVSTMLAFVLRYNRPFEPGPSRRTVIPGGMLAR